MNDIDKFIELYKSFGIECEVVNGEDGAIITLANCIIEGGTFSDKFVGYSGFCSEVSFDKDGRFVSQGFWEH